jgi:hypothetical protein
MSVKAHPRTYLFSNAVYAWEQSALNLGQLSSTSHVFERLYLHGSH